jgi:AcrR family transcriptional regulator
MSGAERKESILRAVRKVFAEKGFRGITSRELAQAAGVSEALLFRHFPSKESLYAAIQESCCRKEDIENMGDLDAREDSTANLVFLVRLLVTEMFRAPSNDDPDEVTMRRLFLRSITEDGEFVRLFLKGLPSQWVRKTEQCLQAAIAAGDAAPGSSPHLLGWFSHHLAAMIAIHLLPDTPIVDYGFSRQELIQHTVWFALRGMGLKEDVIAHHLASPQQ